MFLLGVDLFDLQQASSTDKTTPDSFESNCEPNNLGVADRAERKFFTTGVLRPQGGAQYPAVSQKILSATACRYLIFWLSRALQQIVLDDDIYKHPVNDSLN